MGLRCVLVTSRSTVSVLVLLALGMAACSTTSSNKSASTSLTNAPAPVVSTTTAVAARPCSNDQLAVTIQSSFVGAGSAAEELGFQNVSDAPCSLSGYPGAAALSMQGQQIVQAGRNDADGAALAAVELQPGQIASALLQGSDGSAVNCGTFTRSFLVTPPNVAQSVEVTARSSSAPIGASTTCPIWIFPVSPEGSQPMPVG